MSARLPARSRRHAVSRQRLPTTLDKRLSRLFDGAGFAAAVHLPNGARRAFGGGEPAVTIVARDGAGVAALRSLDALRIGQAYLLGSIDVEGDLTRLLSLRPRFRDRHPLVRLRTVLLPLLLRGQVQSDKNWIARHYDEDPEFFTLFLDERHRCYSHGLFETETDPLEDAMTRKLDFALDAIRAKPGDRVLDVGAGWGSFTEHAGRHGVRVTSLTISQQGKRFVADLIARDRLPCEVRYEHFLEHQPAEPYDAIVNLGVTEHLPDYAASLRHYVALLKPGGRVYLDACAYRIRRPMSTFFRRYVFPGNGTPLCLSDYVAALARSPLELIAVHNDRESYRLTCRHWAENLDRHREQIEERWGVFHIRRFRIYLLASVDGFGRDKLQAYRLVLAKAAAARALGRRRFRTTSTLGRVGPEPAEE